MWYVVSSLATALTGARVHVEVVSVWQEGEKNETTRRHHVPDHIKGRRSIELFTGRPGVYLLENLARALWSSYHCCQGPEPPEDRSCS